MTRGTKQERKGKGVVREGKNGVRAETDREKIRGAEGGGGGGEGCDVPALGGVVPLALQQQWNHSRKREEGGAHTTRHIKSLYSSSTPAVMLAFSVKYSHCSLP